MMSSPQPTIYLQTPLHAVLGRIDACLGKEKPGGWRCKGLMISAGASADPAAQHGGGGQRRGA